MKSNKQDKTELILGTAGSGSLPGGDVEDLHVQLSNLWGRSNSPIESSDSNTEGRRHSGKSANRNDPLTFLEGLRLEAQAIRASLESAVHGQGPALETIAKSFIGNRILNPNGDGGAAPRAAFLFVGPNGAGKGLAARKLCEAFKEYELLTFDMSHFVNASDTAALIGNEPSYQNAAPSTMNIRIRKRPKTLVLFENVEQCHPAVLGVLTSLLSTGELKDLFGLNSDGEPDQKNTTPVDYRQAVLVFSTTAPYDVYSKPEFQSVVASRPDHAETMMLEALLKTPAGGKVEGNGTKQFSPAMVDHWRGGRTVYFQELDLDALTQISTRGVLRYAENLKAPLGCDCKGHTHVQLLQALLLSFAPNVGASEASGAVQTKLFAPLMDYIIQKSDVPPNVKFDISAEGQQDWQSIVYKLQSKGKHEDLLQQCRRRGLRLELGWRISPNCDHIALTSIKLTQVKTGEDLGGPGAIKIEVPEVGFTDIAGHLHIKCRLEEVVHMLGECHNPAMRKITPKGMLLYGPPGTGKTMLAKALAHEVDLPFISTTGTELLSPTFTQEIFRRARKYAPCVVFIDEIDALGSREPNKPGSITAINQLLADMDGFDSSNAGLVFVIAATNWRESIDPALLRAGRLDLHMEVPHLDPQARGFFADRILKLAIDPSVNREKLIRLSTGMSGAEMEQLHRELQLVLYRTPDAVLDASTVIETLNTLRYGQRTSRPLSEDYQRNTAIHEAGHAVISRVVNPEQRISHITIVPRSNAAGYVAFDGESREHRRFTLAEVNDELAVLLAGRCAQEKLQPGSADDGASSDLARATQLALAAVGQLGLVPDFGLMAISSQTSPAVAQALAPDQIKIANALLAQAQVRCNALLEAHWPRVRALQLRLLQDEIVLGEDW